VEQVVVVLGLLFLLEPQGVSIPVVVEAAVVGLQHRQGQELLFLAETVVLV
jgi:hypothetical protein